MEALGANEHTIEPMDLPPPLTIVRASESRWEDVRGLFGRAGAENGCWCQYWLLGPDYHRRDRTSNAADLRSQVSAGQGGMLALRGDAPVGWARLTNRSALTYLTGRFRSYDFTDDDPLSLACFFVRRSARGEGVMTALIEGAKREGVRRGQPIEAYPIDTAMPSATKNRFPGVLSAFLASGFSEVGRLSDDRAVVRSH